MAGILIIAHHPLAQSFLSCAEHVYENLLERIYAIDIFPKSDIDENLLRIRTKLRQVTLVNNAIILTDICGATPANIATTVARETGYPLLAGINLPMLLKVIAYRTRPVEILVQAALLGSTQGVMRLI